MTQPSLIRRLLLGIGLPLAVVIAIVGAIAYAAARDEIGEVYDSQMITWANELWLIARDDPGGGGITADGHDLRLGAGDQAALDEYANWRSFRVWRDGQVVMLSDNAPPAATAAGPRGFRTVARGGETWRVFTLVMPADRIVVEVGEKLRARREVSGRIVLGVSLPLLLVFPVIVLAVWLGIRWGLRDLKRFATTLRARSPDDLSQLDGRGLPAELAPLSDSINHLLTKLEISRGQERLFTDNAAHELRTPLAALVVQAEVARNARSAKERNETLDALSRGAGRTSRLLDQLLTLARVSHLPAQAAPLNLYEAVRESLGDAWPRAQARGIDLALSGDEGAVIHANKALLGLLAGNLVDNAIKYSPAGSPVEVGIHCAEDGVHLVVRDRGPGIPEAERDKVFGRFYRIQGNAETGSGLGLAIVRTICELTGAGIRLFTPEDGEGLGVDVRFPLDLSYSSHLGGVEADKRRTTP